MNAAVAKCAAKLDSAFAKATGKYGATCVASAPSSEFATFLQQCANDAALGASGYPLPDYVGDIEACNAELAAAENDVAACESNLALSEACGNGSVDPGEACDGSDLNAATCTTQGFAGGTLSCASGCTLDTSGCWASRFVDNGDGTVTDKQMKLLWEKKTTAVFSGNNYADPRDVDNSYTWGSTTAPYGRNGTTFTDFIARLNGSADGVCFAGRCDWRLPTKDELASIVDPVAPGCGGDLGFPCISSVFGPTFPGNYWSSSSTGASVWLVGFGDGITVPVVKGGNGHVRAVRGGS